MYNTNLWLKNMVFQPYLVSIAGDKQLNYEQCPPQCLQSPPHTIDLPFFFSLSMCLIINVTMPTRIPPTIIVPIVTFPFLIKRICSLLKAMFEETPLPQIMLSFY